MNALAKITAPLNERLRPSLDKYKAQLAQRWQGLQTREQRLIQVMAVFIALAILWFGFWQPLNERIERAEMRLQAQIQTQRHVEQQIALVLQARNRQQQSVQQVRANQLNSVVNQLTGQLDIDVSRVQPQNESLVLVFNEAQFNALLELLVQLSERGVLIESLDVTETNTTGVVRVRRLQIRATG
ncbi:MAG: type II secretion system protein M [Aliidiomarina sp.]|uniref:type II secretion system protein M n=1 Tax=Aliidiomarina sp. TaxID=1872439 RepID=UPI0025C15DBC|nr:type II secretion system protein M [Aliidiomarina sp.]MCH8502277.1 type II secretion system protein M [Aliidiomarina sp.]